MPRSAGATGPLWSSGSIGPATCYRAYLWFQGLFGRPRAFPYHRVVSKIHATVFLLSLQCLQCGHSIASPSYEILHHKMSRPIEQALLSLLPSHNSNLPPTLVELASSLLAQSRNKASTLKAEEEVARAYACANLACDRYCIAS